MAATTHPDPPIPLIDSLDNLRASISKLQEDQIAKGLVPVPGRIIHVTHYIPLFATLETTNMNGELVHGVPTPPRTPDRQPALGLALYSTSLEPPVLGAHKSQFADGDVSSSSP